MDKLKKNAFAISISGIVLVALVLLYFLVIGRIQAELGTDGVKGQIDKHDKKYKLILKEKGFKYGEKVFNRNQAVAVKQKEAVAGGKEFYEDLAKRFNEPHPEDTSGDDSANFRSFYESNVEKLQEDYRKVFLKPAAAEGKDAAPAAAVPATAEGSQAGEAPAVAPQPADPAAAAVPAVAPAAPAAASRQDTEDAANRPPRVDVQKKIESLDDIQRTRKEFWMLSEVFRVANEQKLGGLQHITFPGRVQAAASAKAAAAAGGAEAGKEYRWIQSRVNMELPAGKLEPFLTALFQSPRVAFRLDSLTMTRSPDSMVIKNVETKIYENKDEAEKDPIDSIRAEPPVVVQFDLSALDYLGPAATPAATPPATEGK